MWFKKKIEQDILGAERKQELIQWMGSVMPGNRLFGEVTEEDLKKMLTDLTPDNPLKVEQVNLLIEARKAALSWSPKTKEEQLFVEGMTRSPWKTYALEIAGVREREERMIPEGDNVFAHYGDRWYVRFDGGQPAWFVNSLGMHYIAYLLKNPGEVISAGELESEITGMEALTGVKSPGQGQSIQTQNDDKALNEYREAARVIAREITKARDDNNWEEKQKLEEELEVLAKNIQGKKEDRTFSDDREQARDRVRKAIAKCLNHMKIRDKDLVNHLGDGISTGFTLMYSPDSTITWKF